MKEGIHPPYGATTIHCACGNVMETRTTLPGVIQVEICSACHPFFTGKQKLVDTAGRIDRLAKKFGSKVALGSQKKKKRAPEPPPQPMKKEKEAAEDTKAKLEALKKRG